MNIDFYFDPSCPFSWITSRWLIQAQSGRDITINWKPFSLAIKNKELDTEYATEHAASAAAAHRILRIITAANTDIGALYSAFGSKRHILGNDYDDDMIKTVLAELNLPAKLLQAADDKKHDVAIQASMDEAIDVVGGDIGVPTIVFEDDDQKAGYFGPVLQDLPSVTESLQLWDALKILATSKQFYELKRNRPAGGPNTASTAICIP